jgi:hydroxymethylbilane synthase
MTTIRLGTRGSKLALWQAHAVRDALMAADPGLPEPEIVAVTTTGDQVRDRRLAEIGGKGLFTKEIDAALLDGRIDAAVHSMKDVETWLSEGTALAAMLVREDPREAFLCDIAADIAGLPRGAKVGTASIRRTAQLLAKRPDLDIALMRGNVDTRIAKLRAGEVTATLLAYAGLKRLDRHREAASILETDDMLPAVGQGAVGITCRAGDAATLARLAAINHGPTFTAVTAERAVLARLDGSCHTPIAALARLEGKTLRLTAMVLSPDGSKQVQTSRDGPMADPAGLGDAAGLDLLDQGARAILDDA